MENKIDLTKPIVSFILQDKGGVELLVYARMSDGAKELVGTFDLTQYENYNHKDYCLTIDKDTGVISILPVNEAEGPLLEGKPSSV